MMVAAIKLAMQHFARRITLLSHTPNLEAIRVNFDGGVCHEKDEKVKNKVGAVRILQIAEKIDNQRASLFQHDDDEFCVVLQECWRRNGDGLGPKVSRDGKGGGEVTNFLFADNCYLVCSSRKELREMMMEATVGVKDERIGVEKRRAWSL